MTISFTKITHDQWFKVLKAFFFVGVSFLLAMIPVWLAHNTAYVALTIPINVVLVTLKQWVTQEETTNPLTPEDKQVMHGVEEVVTDLDGKPVVDPNAPR